MLVILTMPIWWPACWLLTPTGWSCLPATAATGSGARLADTWNPVTPVLAARELLEEATLVARIHPSPIDVHLSSFRCRTSTEPVLHLDVIFAAFVSGSAPALVNSDELTGLEWFATGDLPVPLLPVTTELVGLATAAANSQG